MTGYVHGYDEHAAVRLLDQAASLVDLLHHDTAYPAGARVLEAGCGVGAQTVTLAANSPEARFISVDISADSLAQAEAASPRRASRMSSSSRPTSSTCPSSPRRSTTSSSASCSSTLRSRSRRSSRSAGLLKPGGTMTVIEGDHGSAYYHPASDEAQAAIQCQVDLQAAAGGNANIGREVYPLMVEAGFEGVRVSPRMVYVDASRPELVDGFTRRTFNAMVEGVRDDAIAAGLIEPEAFDAGLRALNRTAEDDGVFCYTFFKGVGLKAPAG